MIITYNRHGDTKELHPSDSWKIPSLEYKCDSCGKWMDEQDAYWIGDFAYHVECAHELSEELE